EATKGALWCASDPTNAEFASRYAAEAVARSSAAVNEARTGEWATQAALLHPALHLPRRHAGFPRVIASRAAAAGELIVRRGVSQRWRCKRKSERRPCDWL